MYDIDVQSDITPEDEAILAPPAEQAAEPSSPQQPQGVVQQHGQQNHGERTPRSEKDETKQSSAGSGLGTPAIRHLAKEFNVKIGEISGTGKDGRVLKEDIYGFVAERNAAAENFLARPPSSMHESQSEKPITLTPIQKQMFKTMTKSLKIPHFLYTDEVDITSLSKLRQKLNNQIGHKEKLSFLHFIIKAVSLALEDYPLLNARIKCDHDGDTPELVLREKQNIGIAIDVPNIGLLVPNIKNTSSRSILEISSQCSRLQALARNNKLAVSDLVSGTFTISNVGNIGGTYVAPVLVPGEVAILGMGRARTVPAFDEHDRVIKKEVMNFSWSADHRVVDGATMARMAERVRAFVEEPTLMVTRLR